MTPARDFVLGRFFLPVRMEGEGVIFIRISHERGTGSGRAMREFEIGRFNW
jgi:hypothetical protein